MTNLSEQIEPALPTGEEVEKELLRREQENPHILDNHATFFALYIPKLMQMLDGMNKKALLRVIELAVKHPIEESDKKLLSVSENNAFNTLNQLMTSKYSMIIYTGMEEMERQEAEKAKEVNIESVIETSFNGDENESKS